jgi:MFS transporter, DHA2 family, methylenomycin A resistance protein
MITWEFPMTTQQSRAGGPVQGTGQPGHGERDAPMRRGLLLGLALGYFMVLMDTTIVTVALPAIGRDLKGGLTALQWISNGYTLTFAALLLTAGTLSDRFGGRRVFLVGLWSFAVISAVSATASSMGMLIGLRALLGIAGALLLPTSLAIVANTFSDPAARAKALGSWAAITGGALAAGPLVGGVLTDTFGWRAIFLVNIPVAAISIAITTRSARETNRKTGQGIDLPGQLAAIVTLAALTYGLIQAGESGWDAPLVLAAFVIFVIAAGLFVTFERRPATDRHAPMLPLRLFRSHTFSAALFAGLLINFALSGLLFTLSLFFQQGRGFTAFTAGLAFLPLTLPTAFNPIFTGRLVARIGPRRPATIGFLLMAGGTLLQAFVTSTSTTALVVSLFGLLLVGFGISYAMPSLLVSVMGSVPRELSGIGSGALNSARQTGAVLGVAVLGVILTDATSIASGTRIAVMTAGALLLVGAAVVVTFVGRAPRP